MKIIQEIIGLEISLSKSEVVLLPEKGIVLKQEKILLLADLHLGKANHFRRSGIAVSRQVNDENIDTLIALLQKYNIQRVIFLGDLFHSHYNQEWEVLGQVIDAFREISFELVMGNHDILSDYQYFKHNIYLHREPLVCGKFLLSHEPLENIPDGLYNLAGHIHPGVTLRGSGRQSITLPCFYFKENQGLLPAFGAFTGLFRLKPKKEERVFVIIEGKVMGV